MASPFAAALALCKDTTERLEAHFVETGRTAAVAQAAAEAFTLYMFGYYTAEGAAQAVHAAGMETGEASSIVQSFIDAKRKAA